MIEPDETLSYSFLGSKDRNEIAEVPVIDGEVCLVTVEPELQDITDAIFTNRSVDCAAYAKDNEAFVEDIKEGVDYNLDLLVVADSESCTFTSNSIPNHDFNHKTADFGGPAREQSLEFTVTRVP